MPRFGVTIPATVPQGSEIPEGLMNNPVYSFLFPPFRLSTQKGDDGLSHTAKGSPTQRR